MLIGVLLRPEEVGITEMARGWGPRTATVRGKVERLVTAVILGDRRQRATTATKAAPNVASVLEQLARLHATF